MEARHDEQPDNASTSGERNDKLRVLLAGTWANLKFIKIERMPASPTDPKNGWRGYYDAT